MRAPPPHLLDEADDHPPGQEHVERARQTDRAVAQGASQERNEQHGAARQGAVAQRPQNQTADDLGKAVGRGHESVPFRAALVRLLW